MKRIASHGLTAFMVFILLFSSCNKSSQAPGGNTTNFGDEINAMVEIPGNSIYNTDPGADEITGDIFMQTGGIPPDYLIDPSYLDEMGGSGDPAKDYIRDHSLIRCLKLISLSDTQKVQVRNDLREYAACKEKAIKRAKEIYHDLHEKYKMKYQELLKALKNGRITREEFHQKVAELKQSFRAELKRMHLKEKLDFAFKKCFRQFLTDLHGVLTERQWNAFRDCYLN